MDSSVVMGDSVIAAVLAGAIALLAPCCISVMLPAYFAKLVPEPRVLTAMTLVFAAGIATVILPSALGAAALRQLLLIEHTAVYLTGGWPPAAACSSRPACSSTASRLATDACPSVSCAASWTAG